MDLGLGAESLESLAVGDIYLGLLFRYLMKQKQTKKEEEEEDEEEGKLISLRDKRSQR